MIGITMHHVKEHEIKNDYIYKKSNLKSAETYIHICQLCFLILCIRYIQILFKLSDTIECSPCTELSTLTAIQPSLFLLALQKPLDVEYQIERIRLVYLHKWEEYLKEMVLQYKHIVVVHLLVVPSLLYFINISL
jgi:hypothetical protein